MGVAQFWRRSAVSPEAFRPRPVTTDRRARERRRRRRGRGLAILAFAAVLFAIAFLLNSRGGIDHPADWFTSTHGVERERIEIDSEAVGKALPAEVLLPKGYDRSDRRPLLVMLHGRGTPPGHLSNSAVTKALADAGSEAPVVVLPYGEEASYWHDRRDGDWGEYVAGELIATVTRKYGIDRRRIAIGGISMGGFGALNLARLHPGRFCAVGGHSPALWQSAGETAAGAFDDADDFARNDVIAVARSNPAAFANTAIWIDAGDEDPFRPGVQAMVAALHQGGVKLRVKTWPGKHESTYWDAHYGAYMRFYTRALAGCR